MTPCQENPELWVALKADDRARAARLCRPCPRIEDCLREALERGERENVYGGVDLAKLKLPKPKLTKHNVVSEPKRGRPWAIDAVKPCPGCGVQMRPRPREDQGNWDLRKFCTRACARRNGTHRRRAA